MNLMKQKEAKEGSAARVSDINWRQHMEVRREFCTRGCGSKTDDYSGICSKCSGGHASKFNHDRKQLSIEELQRRESLDEVYLNMEEGWPYAD